MYKVECGKCGGKGIIGFYKRIQGGTCFNCDGKGYKIQKKKPTIQSEYTIGAIFKETGEKLERIFTIKAKNEDQAIEKAIQTLSKGNGYFPETAFISDIYEPSINYEII
jgi:DnaJ-class molecular chaperone